MTQLLVRHQSKNNKCRLALRCSDSRNLAYSSKITSTRVWNWSLRLNYREVKCDTRGRCVLYVHIIAIRILVPWIMPIKWKHLPLPLRVPLHVRVWSRGSSRRIRKTGRSWQWTISGCFGIGSPCLLGPWCGLFLAFSLFFSPAWSFNTCLFQNIIQTSWSFPKMWCMICLCFGLIFHLSW